MKEIKRLLKHIKRWNRWIKHSIDSKFYKLLVLFGMPSPTFIWDRMCECDE